MRIPINLASEPFRRDRPLDCGSVAVGVMLLGLLVMLVYLAVGERAAPAEARRRSQRPKSKCKPFSGRRRAGRAAPSAGKCRCARPQYFLELACCRVRQSVGPGFSAISKK